MTAIDNTGNPQNDIPIVGEGSPHLTLVVGEGTEQERSIKCRRAVTLIGSRDHCKIVLRHDRVSQVHAAIVNNGTKLILIDLLSRSGTRLNGLKIDHDELSHGDTLDIGPWTFRVGLETDDVHDDSDIHKLGLDPSPKAVALEHKETGRVLKPNRNECTIGRLAGCDIAVDDPRISRCHALLVDYFGQPAIFDLLSRNHTLVNDIPVVFHMLKADDIITVGESSFIVRLVNAMPNKVVGNGKPKAKKSSVDAGHISDLINIKDTESSQRWRVADKAEKIKKVAP
jgi:pSer/pThr/pTyr-binding forkhead associated (FHA) protein